MARKAVGFLYKMARTANDVETLASGDPKRIARRAKNKMVGRMIFGKMSKRLF